MLRETHRNGLHERAAWIALPPFRKAGTSYERLADLFVPVGTVVARKVLIMAHISSETRDPSAEQLAATVAAGHPLPELPSPVLLGAGEVLHADATIAGWRSHAAEVAVEPRRRMGTGLFTFGVAAALNSIEGRRAREEVERLAAPQWRSLGTMPVLATNQRLLLLHEGAWASVWYSAIRKVLPRPGEHQLELIFEDDPPYLLAGDWVPYLTVVIVTVLARGYGVDAVASMIRSA